jgi:hypothetical protein
MAISDAYADWADYKSRYREKLQDADEESVTADLIGVSRFLDIVTGRDSTGFSQDSTPAERRYWGSGRYSLRIDDLASSSGLVVKIDTDNDGSVADETALVIDTDFYLTLNGDLNTRQRGEVWPWNRIDLTSWGGQGVWPAGQLVSITGIWGWPAVPYMIKAATIELTRILRAEGPRATQRINELGEVFRTSREAQGIIQRLVDAYSRITVVAA